jgi:NtrC-family two-component system response regulator AlgB
VQARDRDFEATGPTAQAVARRQTSGAKVLIVDDDRNLRRNLAAVLSAAGYSSEAVGTPREAIQILVSRPIDVLLTDLQMAEMSGLELLEAAKCTRRETRIILMTGYATVQNAIQAMKAGAIDYLTKPFEPEDLLTSVANALPASVAKLRPYDCATGGAGSLVLESRSPSMRRVLETARLAASGTVPILLLGESGTGKSTLARQIHLWSPRAAGEFVVVRCATLSEGLSDRELWGRLGGEAHGAERFTARTSQPGARGTLLLDEVADLSPAVQTKLVEFVQQEGGASCSPTGSEQVPLRLIASSRRDLVAEVGQQRFREDLFFRLNVITLRLPALRERSADLLPLVDGMLHAIQLREGRDRLRFSADTRTTLSRYRWPGNLHELHNALERAAVVCGADDLIRAEHLPETMYRSPSDPLRAMPSSASLDEIERAHTLRVIAESPTLEAAAATLGIDVTTLWRRRKRYQSEGRS